MIRSVILSAAIALAACPLAARAQAPDAEGDPNLWLEEVTGNKALEWVRARNGETREALAGTAEFRSLENDIRKVLDSAARIPYVSKHGAYYYNFWKDGKNPRGLWRR
ncbi:MAG TPA: hypothetical protein PL037_01680, partial [Elusimicrobiales bacterium]|nr:hypothetical protein [Elusimicrobiales bacterium]